METEATQTTTEAPATEAVASVVGDNGETVSTTSYLDGKYKSVSDLENGYKELQSSYSKKLGGFKGAPEAYELAEGIESNSRIEALQTWGKTNQLSNEALNEIISMDMATQTAEMESYIAEQKGLLGKEADTRINNVSDWVKANVGADSIKALEDMLVSAESVKLFEAIIKNLQGTAPAQAPVAKSVDRDTLNQMRFAKDEFGNRRMSSDTAYRAKVIALEEQLG
jgi:hypothetical protein